MSSILGGYRMPNTPFDNPKLKAPLEGKSTKLRYQVQIFVPSTKFDKTVKPAIYNKRIKETETFLSKEFGGDTSIRAKGGYIFADKKNKDKLVTEDVTIVEGSMSKEEYVKKKPKIEKFIKTKQKEWKQESIGYKFEDDFHIYPKF